MERVARILKKPLTATLLAIFFGFIVGAIVLAIAGYNPILAFGSLFRGVFSKPKYIANVIIQSTPIILTGLSVAFAFKTGLFNIGAEGQYIVGAITAGILGYELHLPAALQVVVVMTAAIVVSALYGGIVGLLKAKFGIHEVITCIMLNWVALYLNNFLVNLSAFKAPNSQSMYKIQDSAYTTLFYNWKTSAGGLKWLEGHPILKEIFLRTDLNIGFLVAVIMVIAVTLFLKRTTKGFELRSVGFNKDAAEFAGISVKSNIILSMVIAGGLAGLAGALQVTGVEPHRISILAAFENNGFNGLSVALIANSSPVGCLFAGLLFGGLLYGGSSIQSEIGAPSEIINIMIGTIVFFIALANIFLIIANKLKKRSEKRDVH